MPKPVQNTDAATVDAFSDQWDSFSKRDYFNMEDEQFLFDRFFQQFPWDTIDASTAKGIEIGCGMGRFSQFFAPKVAHLTCIDASEKAITIAKQVLAEHANTTCLAKPIGDESLYEDIPEGSLDYGYSYGVLMHIPDTQKGLIDCGRFLKPGAPFMAYIYYNFDNRPIWFRMIWQASNILRHGIYRMPKGPRDLVSTALAGLLYWPLARLAKLGEAMGKDVKHWPLSDFRSSSFTRMRNNSRDRFGTPLEGRFSRAQITAMMEEAGFEKISFRDGAPYWCVLGFKKA